MYISGSIQPITLIWVSLERYFLLQKLSIDDANFSHKRSRQKWKKGQGSSRAIMGGTGVDGLTTCSYSRKSV